MTRKKSVCHVSYFLVFSTLYCGSEQFSLPLTKFRKIYWFEFDNSAFVDYWEFDFTKFPIWVCSKPLPYQTTWQSIAIYLQNSLFKLLTVHGSLWMKFMATRGHPLSKNRWPGKYHVQISFYYLLICFTEEEEICAYLSSLPTSSKI